MKTVSLNIKNKTGKQIQMQIIKIFIWQIALF